MKTFRQIIVSVLLVSIVAVFGACESSESSNPFVGSTWTRSDKYDTYDFTEELTYVRIYGSNHRVESGQYSYTDKTIFLMCGSGSRDASYSIKGKHMVLGGNDYTRP